MMNLWCQKRLQEPDKQPEVKGWLRNGGDAGIMTGGSGRHACVDLLDLPPPWDGPHPAHRHIILLSPGVRLSPSPRGSPGCLGEGPKGSCNQGAGPWRPLGLHRLFLFCTVPGNKPQQSSQERRGRELSQLANVTLYSILETSLRGVCSRGLTGCVTLGKPLTHPGPLSLCLYNNLPHSLNSGSAFPGDSYSSLWVVPPSLQQPKDVFR